MSYTYIYIYYIYIYDNDNDNDNNNDTTNEYINYDTSNHSYNDIMMIVRT